MKADILKLLLQSHAEGDESAFRKAALQLAAAESSAGHVRVAEEIRSIIAKMPATSIRKQGPVVDIATPRGELADMLEGGHRDERLRDIVLRPESHETLLRVISENRSRARLERFGVSPRRRLLFHGPPGCGKTLAAAVLAGEMGLPLMTVRFDALFSRFLGATAVQLRAIFSEMPRRPGVYLFDEFDSVAKARGDSQDVGEMNRVVTAFLQLVDADMSGSILVAATNHVELLDRAVFRRFDVIVPFDKPSREQISDLLKLRLSTLGLSAEAAERLAGNAEGWSFADVARACDDAVRTMALDDREEISERDVVLALEELKRRNVPVRS
ncbi:AAA family ATPase [Hyalangium versicolor]|uniref:AAA family ATPase n=1 Tax=Hyalangium versicolor TaxID=2861190 RepID=UPI001CCD8387|nr:ATP-binding protein [Hyalangium versicolor]